MLSNIELERYMQTLETDLEVLQKLSDAIGGYLKSDGEMVAILPVWSRESVTGRQPLPLVNLKYEKRQQNSVGMLIIGSFRGLSSRFTKKTKRQNP